MTMITVRRSNERGHARHGWLETRHTFSFADYYDPAHMHFRSLRVINDDVIAGGGGFGMHPHRDMEIISYVVSGALRHADNMGNEFVVSAGNFQQMSAGAGILHSEHNASPSHPVRLLQMWIIPNRKGVQPSYAERLLENSAPGQGHLVASPDGRGESIAIHSDTDLWLLKYAGGETINHTLEAGRHAWLQVATGEVWLNGERLHVGDGAEVSDETELSIASSGASRALLFDLA